MQEGAPRNDNTMNRLSYSPVAINFTWLGWSPTASEALSYGQNFPGGACPQTALDDVNAVRYTHVKKKKKKMHDARAAWPLHNHSMCAPPFFNLWIRP